MSMRGNRRLRAHISEFTVNQLHLRNPFVGTAWSLLAPGLGSLLQNRIVKGLIFNIWGILVNTFAKINTAIAYSLTGHFDAARKIIDTRWLLLYVAVYVYSAWDTYRGTMELNKLYLLADREDAPIQPFIIKTMDVNALDKRNPWVAALWSACMPGLGNLYLHKSIEGMFFVAWTIVIMYYSHCLPAVHYTFTGDFERARSIVNMQWFLYLPAVYVFQIYQSYASAVEYNKLFEKEQSRWLRDHYQKNQFKMPI